jgi:hypothetical protein
LKAASSECTDEDPEVREENNAERDISRIVPDMEEFRQLVDEASSDMPREPVEDIDLSTAMMDEDEHDTFDREVDEHGLGDPVSVDDSVLDTNDEEQCENEVFVPDDMSHVDNKGQRKVKMIMINALSVQDMHMLVRKKMLEMDLPQRRLRRQLRDEQERVAMYENLF